VDDPEGRFSEKVFAFPAFGGSVHGREIALPFQITETIRMLIPAFARTVLPNSQVFRSTAKTQGLPENPSRSATSRGIRLRRARDRSRQTRQTDRALRHNQERRPGQSRTPRIRRFDVVLSGLG
jgi:hypothetical protein